MALNLIALEFQMSSSDSTTPSGSKGFMHMPAELFDQVDAHLSFEDSTNFKSAHPLIDVRLTSNLIHYDKIHLSDEEDECWISDTRCRVAPRKFRANNVSVLIRSLENLREITVIMKDVNIKSAQSLEKKAKLTDYTPYTPGGYLAKLFNGVDPAELRLRQLSLHVDIMVESLQDVYSLQCPTEDLSFSMNHLINANFNSFIQVSL
ncbi:hypothetical protein GCK72_016659 [Caenorhabditis remanei]|uniref:Uncharacterized protein n=1 Tax=Caenorhabditis remanei TaxID=31234 RepID=A0A6A5G5N0_CAERE|nr:hypothetical protein GCK72_016659 [Caenorhabditis remanei]KAF1750113.1 hypothetical protein GCK72_016659 [Caenorhabditis remanei]